METREKIILTAMRLFNEQGFHGTSTAKIARESKISNGSLFNAFPSKEKLVNAVYLYVKNDCYDFVCERTSQDEPARQRLASFWKAMVLWGISCPQHFRFQELYNHSPYINEELDRKIKEKFAFIYGAFGEGLEQGLFRSRNRDLIMAQYYAWIKGFVAYALEAKLEMTAIEDELNHSYELLTKGLFF